MSDVLATHVLCGVMALLGRTWRYETAGLEHLQRLRDAHQPAVYLVWHGQLLPITYRHRREGVVILVSRHRDGGYLAATAERWGYRVVRGSTRRGGAAGLLAIVRQLRDGREVALTPDGPRGPAEQVQPGAVAAAQHAGVPIIPVAASVDRAWRLRSWDRFLVPKPFARVRLVYGTPIAVSPGAAGLEAGVSAVQRALETVALPG